MIKWLKPKKGLEIGFGHYGFSAKCYLENCEGTLTSVDQQDWKGHANKLQDENPRFSFVKRRSENLLNNWYTTYDFIYIDGDHRYEGAKRDMEMCAKLLDIGGHMALDDCAYDLRSGVDVFEHSGDPFDGEFGVGKAADEVFENENWERVTPPEPLANGGRVYKRLK